MISLSRPAVARFRAVLRRGLPRDALVSAVNIRCGSRGTCIEADSRDVAVRLAIPGRGPAESISLAPGALDALAGNEGEVALATAENNQVAASWENHGAAFHRQFECVAAPTVRPFPPLPRAMAPVDASLMPALAMATPLAAKDATRYTMNRLCLDGQTSKVVATDSKQLLILGHWKFPWSDRLLIPAWPLWTCRELRPAEPVTVGLTDRHLVIQAGPWTVVVTNDKEGRFPPYQDIMPKAEKVQTRVHFEPADVEVLRQHLPRLAESDPDNPAVTLVTGHPVEIHATSSQLKLPAALAAGPQIRLTADPRHLLRAVRLGFADLNIVSPTSPAWFFDATRQFVFMPLDPPKGTSSPSPEQSPQTHSKETIMASRNGASEPSANGSAHESNNGATVGAAGDPLSDAEAIRSLLRDVDTRLSRLITYLKHHKRQARALRSAADALRGLPELAS